MTKKSLRAQGGAEYEQKKSRFIGSAAPAADEAAALAFIESIRRQHPDASHNCYAYIIGTGGSQTRFSDDGEPGGTAGMPICKVMQAQDIVDAVVVVTRYFGGTLLGASGLVRAYAHTAALALAAAGVSLQEETATVGVDVQYTLLDKLEYQLKSRPYKRIATEYGELVTLLLAVRLSDMAQLESELAQWSDGRATGVILDVGWQAWD